METRKSKTMKTSILIFISFLLLDSCVSGQEKCLSNNLNGNKYLFPDSLYSFFPECSENLKNFSPIFLSTNAEKTDIPYLPYDFEITSLVEIYLCKDKKFEESIKKRLLTQSIQIAKAESKDYFIIGSERELLSRYDTINLHEKYIKCIQGVLVGNFHERLEDIPLFFSSNTISGLPEGYNILIIQTGDEYVLPEKDKFEWNLLPEELKHGYRCGVAFNDFDPYFIYWIFAW